MACDYLNIPPPHTTGRLPVKPAGSIPPPVEITATKEYVLSWVNKINSRIDELVLGSMEPATASRLGGVIIGDGVNVDASGRISVPAPDLSGILTNYLTKTDASSTYAKLSALTSYLTKTDAGLIYATKQELAGLELTGDYVPLVRDNAGNLSAATLGSRSSNNNTDVGVYSFSTGYQNKASGGNSHAEGSSVVAKGINSHAEGCTTKALENCSHAEGKFTEALGEYSHAAGFRAKAQKLAYAWSGVESDTPYDSNGEGTYNINPAQGIKGFFIGQKNLKTILSEEAPVPDLSGYVKKTANGGISLQLQYDEDKGDYSPLFLGIEGAVRMGQPSTAADEALLEMQAGGRPGGFKVRVLPSYDENTGEEASSTTVSIDDIPDVAAELRKLSSAKRDSTDNIAAADSVVFSPWKFHCDVPEIQAALEGYFLDGFWSDGYWFIGCPDVNGYMVTSDSWQGAEDAVSLINDSVYQDQNTGAMVAVTATRERTVYTKSGEPYVTPTGVKYLGTVPLRAITPEVSGTDISFAPVDGAANYTNGTVSVIERSATSVEYASMTYSTEVGYSGTDDWVSSVDVLDGSAFDDSVFTVTAEYHDAEYYEEGSGTMFTIVFNKDLACSAEGVYDSFGSVITTVLPAGTYILAFKEGGDITNESVVISEDNGFTFEFDDCERYYEKEGQVIMFSVSSLCIKLDKNVTYYSPCVKIPKALSVEKARQFLLTVATDAISELDVAWQDGEVVEAFPGASKLAVGTTVWDVREVAPGKMLVNRTPGASGGSVTLTSESGSSYELKVNNDGELEVKES